MHICVVFKMVSPIIRNIQVLDQLFFKNKLDLYYVLIRLCLKDILLYTNIYFIKKI